MRALGNAFRRPGRKRPCPPCLKRRELPALAGCAVPRQCLSETLAFFHLWEVAGLEMDRTSDKLLQAIQAAVVDGKLPCPIALRIANELGLSPRQVGDTANSLKIKISHCQLGCFR